MPEPTLRDRIARVLADHEQADLGLSAHRYPPEKWACCADAVLAALDPPSRDGERDLSRYDLDPDAIEWARRKIQHHLDRAEDFRQHATAAGNTEMAGHWRVATAYIRRSLLGGKGCVIAAFDQRLPEITRATGGEVAW